MTNLFAKMIEPPRDHIPAAQQRFSNRDLRILLVPLIFEQILGMLVGAADTVMVSYAGEAAISGVSLVDMVNGVFLFIFNALAGGGTIVVAQYMGSRQKETSLKAANQLIMITTLIAAVFCSTMLLGRRLLLGSLFGQVESGVMRAAMTYLVVTAFSYPFMAAYSSFCALFRAMGNSKITMRVSLGMNILNVIGNAIAVFALKAGVLGVAVSSLVSRAAAAFVMLVLLKERKGALYIVPKWIFTWDGRLLRDILSIAVPSAVEIGCFQAVKVVLAGITATFGTAQIAAHGVASSIDNINILVNSAVSLAVPAVVGRCVGAGDHDQASYYTKKLCLIAQYGTMVLDGAMYLMLPFILKLYALSPEAIYYTRILVLIHTTGSIVLGTVAGPLVTALRAAGDARFTMNVGIAALILGRLLFSYLFAVKLGFGVIGMWMAMPFHWAINSGAAILRFRSGKWKEKGVAR
ncbi:MAG: MATE family efflux transporter [Firmicutes bacterium]|nr:MATE family efflux transporter [Bacillota bacterium]